MNTLEGNKLIAEFTGWTFAPNVNHESESPTYELRDAHGFNEYRTADMFSYHSSWDWLMPVVEKIEKDFATEFEITIYSASCYIQKWNKKKQSWDSFVSGVGKKIEAVYDAVVQFIQWYNSQSKTDNNDRQD